jgi:hypothetical protein
MDNTMDINLGGGNSMPNLSFYWIAEFEEDCIYQIENGIEHRFKEVQDRIQELKYFTLQHKEKDLNFSVDLILGIITFNKNYQAGIKNEEKQNIRLIFFRRHKREFNQNLKEINHTITYYLGYQYLDKLGNNRQIILQIDSEGNWILGE